MIVEKGKQLPLPEKMLVLETALGLYETKDPNSRNGDNAEYRMSIRRRGSVPDWKCKDTEMDSRPVIFQLAADVSDDMTKKEFLEAAKKIKKMLNIEIDTLLTTYASVYHKDLDIDYIDDIYNL